MKFMYCCLIVLASVGCYAQAPHHFISIDSLFQSVRPFAMVQLWSLGSLNHRLAADTPKGEAVDDRLSFYARRARVGFRGRPYKNFSYVLQLFYDNLLRDPSIGTRGASNTTANLGVFDAFITWKVKGNEMLNITSGFFRPQIGRESITSAWAVSSLEKSWSQFYTRQVVVGRGNGRTVGLNVGGLKKWFHYNVGIFNTPGFTKVKWSPLFVGRVAFTVGDPEMKKYKLGYQTNYYGNRKGITLALASSQQGETDQFLSSSTYSVDLLLNYQHLNINGEVTALRREMAAVAETQTGTTGYLRASYNIPVSTGVLEPSLMFSFFEGNAANIVGAGMFAGSDNTLDIGMNWYLNKHKLMLLLHYVNQYGSGVNNYMDETTGFQRGDYMGLGLNFIL